jgi:hypothetical protein
VVEIIEPGLQTAIAEFRAAGLNVMMSMKQEGKAGLVRRGLRGAAAASRRLYRTAQPHLCQARHQRHHVCARFRRLPACAPVLNLKLEKDVKAMRAIAEEAFATVREYKGSHSGEHGDGIVRSEFTRRCSESASSADFAEVKQRFDPEGVLNPGKIVDPPEMDDRSLFRYPPDYRVAELKTALDWSAYPGAGGGFQGAVEMCNNNGACRKLEGGVMCPSYRATRNEKDVTRGRAEYLASGDLRPARSRCPRLRRDTGHLNSACPARPAPRMPYRRRHGQDEDRGFGRAGSEAWAFAQGSAGGLSAALCGTASRFAALANWRNNSPLLRMLFENVTGSARSARLPEWRRDVFSLEAEAIGPAQGREVVLFADTFNRAYEREN